MTPSFIAATSVWQRHVARDGRRTDDHGTHAASPVEKAARRLTAPVSARVPLPYPGLSLSLCLPQRVKVIARNPTDYTRERSQDVFKLARNADPALHPLERAREYRRAVNATKLERVFAKPFVGALAGHADGVYCLAKHPAQLACVVSGSADGGMPPPSTHTHTHTHTRAHSHKRGPMYGAQRCALGT
jgi:hypothetical protein